jgi:hypothetical protein
VKLVTRLFSNIRRVAAYLVSMENPFDSKSSYHPLVIFLSRDILRVKTIRP